MLIKNVRTSEEPHDRLTQMCNAVGAAFEGHIDHRDGDRAIIIIEDETDVGSMLVGYDHQAMALVVLLGVLESIMTALGEPQP